MKSDLKRCPYCKEQLPKSQIKTHVEYEHGEQLRNSLARLKIALPIVLVGFSIVIGMLYGMFLL